MGLEGEGGAGVQLGADAWTRFPWLTSFCYFWYFLKSLIEKVNWICSSVSGSTEVCVRLKDFRVLPSHTCECYLHGQVYSAGVIRLRV